MKFFSSWFKQPPEDADPNRFFAPWFKRAPKPPEPLPDPKVINILHAVIRSWDLTDDIWTRGMSDDECTVLGEQMRQDGLIYYRGSTFRWTLTDKGAEMLRTEDLRRQAVEVEEAKVRLAGRQNNVK